MAFHVRELFQIKIGNGGGRQQEGPDAVKLRVIIGDIVRLVTDRLNPPSLPRARIAYTLRDDYVETTSGPGSGALPIYVKPFDQLDASISYAVNGRIDITLDGSNLLNSATNTYFGEVIRPRFNSIVDRRIGLSIRIKN